MNTNDTTGKNGSWGNSDKVKGTINEVIGSAKAKIGEVIHNHELEVKGKAQEMSGKAQKNIGNVKNKADSLINN